MSDVSEIRTSIFNNFNKKYVVMCAVDHGVMQGYVGCERAFVILSHPKHGDMYINPAFITSIREIEDPNE